MYPNPGRDRVHLAYDMPKSGDVTISFFNLNGEQVGKIRETHPGGQVGQSVWETRSIAPGIYLMRIVIRADSGEVLLDKTKKIAIVR
jgi:hypothetical protein